MKAALIEELGIRDLGVIAEATLPLGAGFTAVTGETGAGKTMVVTALGLLLGARADAGAVRSGAKQAWVEGRWLVPDDGAIAERVAETGGDVEGGELLLGRSVSSEGRSRAVVGGRSAPVGVLGELGDELVVVHGQADQQRLRSAAAQRDALDRFAGAPLQQALGGVPTPPSRPGERMPPSSSACARRTTPAPARPSELREALDEVEAADPQPGEDAELAERADRLSNLEELQARRGAGAGRSSRPKTSSTERPTRSALVDSARRHLERVIDHDAALAPIAEALQSAGFLLADAATELAGYLAGLDADGARELEIVQERRALITALVRRHGGTLDDVLEFRRTGGLRLVELDGDDDRIEGLEASVAALDAEVDRLAGPAHRAAHRRRRAPRRRGDRRARGPRDARRAPHA